MSKLPLLLLLSLVRCGYSEIDGAGHPVINPGWDDPSVLGSQTGPVWPAIYKALPPKMGKFTSKETQDSSNGKIPEACSQSASTGFAHGNPSDVHPFEVTFSDCPSRPIFVCHEESAEATLDEFLNLLTVVPPPLRAAW